MNILAFLKGLTVPLIVAASFLFYKLFPKMKKDNKVEQFAEQVIQYKTGKEIDLTPFDDEFETLEKAEREF